jgi:A/G-specific adenine glycosylase
MSHGPAVKAMRAVTPRITSHTARDRRIASRLERWFALHKRALPWRASYDPYHVWISEVMLQQTRMEVVLSGYYGKFLQRFPTIDALAAASEDEVLAAWSGLGYYQRAAMLRSGAIDLRERFGSRMPSSVDDLRSITGIGRYTAGAISSIAFDHKVPIVDGNVGRIICRLDGVDSPLRSRETTAVTWLRSEALVSASSSARQFNQSMMELGALVCRPSNPDCDHCPVRRDCAAFATGRTAELPRKPPKSDVRHLRIRLFLVRDGSGRILLQKEMEGRLMRSMYHLPHGDAGLLPGCATDLDSERVIGSFRHTVTNRRITFEVCAARTGSMRDTPGEFAWIAARDLHSVPHPSYVKKALRLAGLV